jgi:hypothetical protein
MNVCPALIVKSPTITTMAERLSAVAVNQFELEKEEIVKLPWRMI